MLQCLEEEQHGSSVHEQREERKRKRALTVKQQETAEGERFHPNQQRQTGHRCGDVTENQNFYFRKTLHQSLAIHVVEGRSHASAQDQSIAQQESHVAKGSLPEVTHRQQNYASQSDRQR